VPDGSRHASSLWTRCATRARQRRQINEAAQEAMNDALEDFERVEAEVLAVFDQLDEEGRK
jgi:hypothetical protein